jgi:hypothetical protein
VFQEDARRVPLSRFGLRYGERFRYEYDFVADRKLDIRLEEALPAFAAISPTIVSGTTAGTASRQRYRPLINGR